jgi:hypothetical protein
MRFHNYDQHQHHQQEEEEEEAIYHILDDKERQALKEIQEETTGPFATVWKVGEHHWDGMAAVRQFWAGVPSVKTTSWQHPATPSPQQQPS